MKLPEQYEKVKVRLSVKDFDIIGNLEVGEYDLADYILNNQLLPLEWYWDFCEEISTAYEN